MLQFLLKRIIILFITLIGITILLFIVLQFIPSDPLKQLLTDNPDSVVKLEPNYEENLILLKRMYNFDKPIPVQYIDWLIKIGSFDFGRSKEFKTAVSTLLVDRAWITLQINFSAILLMYLLSFILGIYSAKRYNSFGDKAISLISYLFYSIPIFVIAQILIILLNRQLGILPSGGLFTPDITIDNNGFIEWITDRLSYRILPIISLALAGFAYLAILIRGSFLDVMSQNFVIVAKARGFSDRQITRKFVFKNALIPIVTHFSSVFPLLFSGSIVIEYIFQIDGIGKLSYDAIIAKDYNLIMAITFISSLLTLLGILLSDLLYMIIDPRISFEGGKQK